MAALILDHSSPVSLVCAVATATTLSTLALVAGVATVVETWRGRRLWRAM